MLTIKGIHFFLYLVFTFDDPTTGILNIFRVRFSWDHLLCEALLTQFIGEATEDHRLDLGQGWAGCGVRQAQLGAAGDIPSAQASPAATSHPGTVSLAITGPPLAAWGPTS